MVVKATNAEQAFQNFDVTIQDNTDTFSYTAAHPDHTLVLAGPPRFSSLSGNSPAKADALPTLGSIQSILMSSAKPWQPYQPIGQIASTFLGSKTQNQAQISRLLANGPNLLKALYSGFTGTQQPDPAIFNNIPTLPYFAGENDGSSPGNFWINLDNPLFHVPIGLGILFRNKAQQGIGGIYLELMVIQSFQTQVQMGQAMILENVGLLYDRAIPLVFSGKSQAEQTYGLDLTQAGFKSS